MTTKAKPHSLLSWLTRHLFMGSTTMYPLPHCRLCANAIEPTTFSEYREGQASSGCTVIMNTPDAKGIHDNIHVSIRMRMTNLTPDGDSDDLKVTFTTRLYGEQQSEYSDGIDIRTTRTFYDVSTLSIAGFRDLFKSAVQHHYSFIPESETPLITLVDRMFEEM